ncbi:MAG: amidohydrolase [Sutterellaceae bacterium]|nr:amidohydrolase [Sutterellaceae bacterium]
MSTLLIRNVELNRVKTNILVKDGRFADLNASADTVADEVYDATDEAILPSFHNTHTHAAMTLLRGYADDMELFKWLNDHVWPFEAKMQPQDIYDGSRLAILEMIRTGTTFFCDMYWMSEETVKAVDEMGVRAAIGVTVMDPIGKARNDAGLKLVEDFVSNSGRVTLIPAPHAVYTAGPELLQRCTELSRKKDIPLTLHVAETEKEVADCIAQYGLSPVRWLDKLGVLNDKTVVAHCIHVDAEEIDILKERGVVLAHNPCSNMKLGSGFFKSQELIDAGCRITLGTDGACSNNNLDMREEMKFAALMAKVRYTPETLPAGLVLDWATKNGAQAFGLKSGTIEVGALADAVFVDLNNDRLVPNYNLVSNWVYAADSSAISSTMCDGKFLMQKGIVENQDEILAKARESVRRLTA